MTTEALLLEGARVAKAARAELERCREESGNIQAFVDEIKEIRQRNHIAEQLARALGVTRPE